MRLRLLGLFVTVLFLAGCAQQSDVTPPAADAGPLDATVPAVDATAPDVTGPTDAPSGAIPDGTSDANADAPADAVADADVTVDARPDAAVGPDACVPEADTAFCARLGRACGSLNGPDNCGAPRMVSSCGTCAVGQVCTALYACAACTSESDTAFCARLGKNCGFVYAYDNCTQPRSVSCGDCGAGTYCTPQNTCACTPESDSAFCARLGKNCGALSSTDNCGAPRTVTTCGNCGAPQVCGTALANVCCTPESDTQFCARLGKNCGTLSSTDNCGTPRSASSCGTCTTLQACGAQTPNVCGCVAETDAALCARYGNACGTIAASDTCGTLRSPNCGGCAPGYACTANACVGGAATSCWRDLFCGSLSCCDSLSVPGGTFPMGRSSSGTDACPPSTPCGAQEQPEHTVTVATFRLDTFEVSVGRFRRYIESFTGTPPATSAGAHPLIAQSGWMSGWNGALPATTAQLIANIKCDPTMQSWTDTAGANESKPINCVSWYEAFAFCIWDNARLPTEAEWEYAAAGGSDNRLYPWGSTAPDCTLAAFYNGAFCYNPGAGGTAPVGTYSSSNARWGHRDLAGNVQEWVFDWYDATWYSGGGATCTNCASTAPSGTRVMRGGAFSYNPQDLRAASRGSLDPTARASGVGFRCARNP